MKSHSEEPDNKYDELNQIIEEYSERIQKIEEQLQQTPMIQAVKQSEHRSRTKSSVKVSSPRKDSATVKFSTIEENKRHDTIENVEEENQDDIQNEEQIIELEKSKQEVSENEGEEDEEMQDQIEYVINNQVQNDIIESQLQGSFEKPLSEHRESPRIRAMSKHSSISTNKFTTKLEKVLGNDLVNQKLEIKKLNNVIK